MAAPVSGGPIREYPVLVAGIGSAIGYALVIGTFLGLVPGYPDITLEQSTALSHGIAIVNAITIVTLLAGWYWIRRDAVDRHRIAMSVSFLLILGFLSMYLLRIGGGGTKTFVGPSLVRTGYLLMLAIHILLSILSVPLVSYVLVLGIGRTPAELRRSPHARIGRVAAGAWVLSLSLGLVTYLLLEHAYEWEYVAVVI